MLVKYTLFIFCSNFRVDAARGCNVEAVEDIASHLLKNPNIPPVPKVQISTETFELLSKSLETEKYRKSVF